MTDQNDIFKRLAEYEVNPPSELWSQILRTVEPGISQNQEDIARGIYAGVQEVEINPPVEVFQTLLQKIEDPYGFNNLHDHEVAAPASVTNSLFEALKKDVPVIKSSNTIIRKLGEYRITAAAAAVLLVVGGWLLFKSADKEVTKGSNNNTPVAQKTTPVAPTIKDTSLQLVLTNKKVGQKKRLFVEDADDLEPTPPPFSVATVMIGEYSYKFNFTDNDVLASFANFTSEDAPPFMTDDKEPKAFTIQLDQFTAITVSDKMSAMMKRMNSFRKSGKPTNKARRERRRLEAWKKTDEKTFDTRMNNNPLDPIDLAEFIFH